MTSEPIRLTAYSHGAGCGCKIAPDVLAAMLAGGDGLAAETAYPRLLVGNARSDDAAAFDLGDGRVILSTTDFFMPIVDDPFDFGRIAATNAISDIYAMGGTPLMAIAILGWPVNLLAPEIAGRVLAGGRSVCAEAGIPLAGGHSIDAPEPIFGLAVTGTTSTDRLKRNDSARVGDRLYLTKPLGIGILTTAGKQGLLEPGHAGLATVTMTTLNRVGTELAAIPGVTALTDVTGFGLAGHLLELCRGAGLNARIDLGALPVLDGVPRYIAAGAVPGGSQRNFAAYGHQLESVTEADRLLVCDPQTSGGLLVAVDPDAAAEVEALLRNHDCHAAAVGELGAGDGGELRIRFGDGAD